MIGPALAIEPVAQRAMDRRNGVRIELGGPLQRYLDDVSVNLLQRKRGVPFSWKKSGLGRGNHTLQIASLGEKSSESLGVWINVSAFDVSRRESLAEE